MIIHTSIEKVLKYFCILFITTIVAASVGAISALVLSTWYKRTNPPETAPALSISQDLPEITLSYSGDEESAKDTETDDRTEDNTDNTKPEDPVVPVPPPEDQSGEAGYHDIQECTRGGDDLLVLVNKQYKLPETYAPSNLASVNLAGFSGSYQLRSTLIEDLKSMKLAAESEGHTLTIISAYRSYQTQVATYNKWVNELGKEEADRVSARPGHSQHQLGTAVDFNQLAESFGESETGKWLAEHAWEYGFALAYPKGQEETTGYAYEPWHFRYIGIENAKAWHDSGKILETYLRDQNGI